MTDLQPGKERRAELLLLIVVVIWASNYPLAKWALIDLSPLLFNGIRFSVAALLLAVLFFRSSSWVPIASGDWYRLLRAGFIANVVYQMAFIFGLNMTSAGNAAILLSTSPLWTLLLGSGIHKEYIKGQMWIGMAVSLAGVVMIIIGSGKTIGFGGTEVYGDLISLAAAAFWGWNTNLQKPLVAKYPSLQVTFIMISVGSIGLVAASIPSVLTTPWATIQWMSILAAVVSGVLSIGIANIFWTTGVKHLGPGRTAVYTNLIPVLAFVFSYFALNENVHLIHFVGAAVTVFGVWYARR